MRTVMLRLMLLLFSLFMTEISLAVEISFKTEDKATIYANYQQRGSHAVLLAHGAIFNKESWGKFEQSLLDTNFTVLAIDFRGYNKSTQGEQLHALYKDILAGVKFLRNQNNIDKVTVLGASMGGAAASKASVYSAENSIDQLILLSPAKVFKAEALKGDTLFIASKKEYLKKSIETAFNKAADPKQLLLINGKAHAQHIFKTDQSEILSAAIIKFLKSIGTEDK